MFFVTYLRRELSRRGRQAVFVALGLALGVGLVVTVSAASTGVKRAESQVLGALDGIGTDVTVTGVTTVTGVPPSPGSLPAGTSTGLAEGADGPEECFVDEGCTSLNGKTISLVGSPYSPISMSKVTEVAGLHDVTGAVGGLMLNDQTASFPKVPARTLALLSNVYLEGVDTTRTSVGPLSTAKVVSGHGLTAAGRDSAVAVVDSSFAASNNLKVGSSLTIATGSYTVIGIITQPQVSNPTDIYIPLGQAQALSTETGGSLRGEVNTIYVTAASAADISAVHAEITKVLPDTQIATQSSLASEVTGSIASAEKLASGLGTFVSALALIAAFAIAGLLTMAAVNRRATEFGTLKAFGWRSRRIIGQVLGETVAMGIAGAVAGVGLGYAGAGIIGAVAPKLSADVPGNFNPNSYTPNPAKNPARGPGVTLSAHFTASTGGKTPTPTRLHGSTGEPSLSHTVAVTLHPPVTFEMIALAVALALLGGLLAGALASWRIARLRPADALGRVA
jgi:putative ABC transport system permease protein